MRVIPNLEQSKPTSKMSVEDRPTAWSGNVVIVVASVEMVLHEFGTSSE